MKNPWRLDDKLIVVQLVKKFFAFYRTENFVTVFTRDAPSAPYPKPSKIPSCFVMTYFNQNYWLFVRKTRKYDVSETGSVSVFK
jgi:hypothetical protein